MAFDLHSMRLGAARVLIDGLDVGFTQGGVAIDLKTTTKRVEIDHFGTVEVRDVVARRELSIKFELAETNIGTLYLALGHQAAPSNLGNVVSVTLPSGIGTTLHQQNRTIDLHPMDRAALDFSENFHCGNVAWSGNLSYAYTVDKVRVFSLEFFAYPDSTGKLMYLGVPIALPTLLSSPTQLDPNNYVVTGQGDPITLGNGDPLVGG